MPKGDKKPYNGPNLKLWKKGQSGNPGGMKKGVVAKHEWKMHTRASVAETFSRYVNATTEDLKLVKQNNHLPILDVIIAGALLRDRLEGELDNTERILDRCIGKVTQIQEFQGIGGTALIPPSFTFVPVDAKAVKTPEELENTGKGPDLESNVS